MRRVLLVPVFACLCCTAALAQEPLDEIVEKLNKADRATAMKMFPDLEKRLLIGVEDKRVLIDGKLKKMTHIFFNLPVSGGVKLLYYCRVLKTGSQDARTLAADYLKSHPLLVADTLEELTGDKDAGGFDLAAEILLGFADVRAHEDSPSGFALCWDVRDETAFVLLDKKTFALTVTSPAALQDLHGARHSAREGLRRDVLRNRAHKKEKEFVEVLKMRLNGAREKSAWNDFRLALAFVEDDLDTLEKVVLDKDSAAYLKELALRYLQSSGKPEVTDRLRSLLPKIENPETQGLALSAFGEAARSHCTREKNAETALDMLKDTKANKKVRSWAREFFALNARWEQVRKLGRAIDTFKDEELLKQVLSTLHNAAHELGPEQKADLSLDVYEKLDEKGLAWVKELLGDKVERRFAQRLYDRANEETDERKKRTFRKLALKVTNWYQSAEEGQHATAAEKPEPKTLRWLYRHQDYSGRWNAASFPANCDVDKGARCDGRGGPGYDITVSSLSLLALLDEGNTHKEGPFQRAVVRGMEWVYSQRHDSGFLGTEAYARSTEHHALAALAFCRAYRATGDNVLREPAARAVEFLLTQQAGEGGWKSSRKAARPSVLTTLWAVLALKAAKEASLEVPESSFKKALAFFDLCRFERQKAKAGFFQADRLQAVAAAALGSMTCGRPAADERIAKLVEILEKEPPKWDDGHGPVYWYLSSRAMYMYGNEAKWKKWAGAVREMLAPKRREGGCADGSWDPVGPDASSLGRIGATAFNQLTIRLSQRYIEGKSEKEGRE